MNTYQMLFLVLYGVFSCYILIVGVKKVKLENKPFHTTPQLLPLGIFVWGDAVILGTFWVLVTLIALVSHSWDLFLLFVSVFWLVRSIGEVVYWLNQQFSQLKRNPPEKLFLYTLFPNESIWFAYQLFWQCIAVISVILTIYFTHLWLATLF